MTNKVIVEGFEPFDLLRLTKDAFYSIVNEQYNRENDVSVEIDEMELCAIPLGDKVVIEATVLDYRVK